MVRSNFFWLSGIFLLGSLAWSADTAIEDENFLLFLADSIVDEDTLTDPLHMVEMMGKEEALKGEEEVEYKVQTEQMKRLQEGK